MGVLNRLPLMLSSFLNLRKGEEKPVVLLLIFSFFQFFALAVFFVTANAVFLANHSIGELPYVFVYSGVALTLLAILFDYLEKVISPKQLILSEAILLFIMVILLRFGFGFKEIGWLAYALIVGHRVMADYIADGFNRLALLLFDVRQGKRLFGIVSSAEIPASILGYITASSLAISFGTANLLWLSGAGLLLALVVLFVLVYKSRMVEMRSPADEDEDEQPKPKNFIENFFQTRFIFFLALTIFFSVSAFCIIEFAFLSQVDARFQDQVNIIQFIAYILIIGQLVAFFIKTFLYSYIQRKFGIQVTLVILPLTLLLITTASVIENTFFDSTYLVVWTWVAIMLMGETLRSSIYNTTFLSLLQPLGKKQRLAGHGILGNTETVALIFSGAVLSLTYTEGEELLEYGFMLMAVVFAWIMIIPEVNKNYLVTLEDIIKKRVVDMSSLRIDNPQTIQIINQKLASEHPGEVLYALDVLLKEKSEEGVLVLGNLLEHKLPEVRREIFGRIIRYNMFSLQREVKNRITDEPINEIKRLAIETYCFLGEGSVVDEICPYMDDADSHIQTGAIVGLIRFGGINGVILAGARLIEYVNDSDPRRRAFGAYIIGEVGIHNFYHPLLSLLDDEDGDVRKEALKSSGRVKHPKLYPGLLKAIYDQHLFEVAIQSVVRSGDGIVRALTQEFKRVENNPRHFRRLVYACGRVGGVDAVNTLKTLIYYRNIQVRNQILMSCAQTNFHPDNDDRQRLVSTIHAELTDACWFLNCLETLSQTSRWLEKKDEVELLERAVRIEVSYIKKRLLYLLAFLYDSREILNVWESLQIKDKEKIANALEIIDVRTPKELSSVILPLLENFPITQLTKLLNAKYQVPKLSLEEYLRRLISGRECPSVIEWTQAVAAWSVMQIRVKALTSELESAREQTNPILAETAYYTLEKIRKDAEPEELELASDTIVHYRNGFMKPRLLTIEKVMALKTTEIFRETGEDLLVEIATILKDIMYHAGDTIVQKNEIGTCMFIIYSGSVKVHDGELVFAKLKAGDFFGELSLLDTEPRSASVTALEDSILLRIDQQAFYEIMADRSEVIREIMKILCRRLRRQNQEVARLSEALSRVQNL